MLVCNFSHTHYEEILQKIKETHKFVDFFNCSNNDIILRHDVDVSLKDALKMAQIEHKVGVTSTFFILFHAELYNPFNLESTKIIREISQMGHKIGLHYNTSFFVQNSLDSSESIKKELELMEQHFDTPVRVISAHDPGINKNFQLNLPSGIINAYSDQFIKGRKYLSDSVQNWREGCLCKNFHKYNKLQVLIHPVWWTSNGADRENVMHFLLNNQLSINENNVLSLSAKWKKYILELSK